MEPDKPQEGVSKEKESSPVGCFIMIVCAIVFLVLLMMVSNRSQNQPQNAIGRETFLESGMSDVPIATTEAAFKEWTKAKIAKDTHGMAQLMLSGSVFLVKNGTRVLVIDFEMFKTKVRILGGNQTGRAGWVPSEYVK